MTGAKWEAYTTAQGILTQGEVTSKRNSIWKCRFKIYNKLNISKLKKLSSLLFTKVLELGRW